MGYEKVQEAPPPYTLNEHQHVDYGAAAGSANAVLPPVAPETSVNGDVAIPIPVVQTTVPMYAVTEHKPPPPTMGKSCLNEFGNIAFMICGLGLPMALLYIFMCIALCLMIIGLPYAKTLLQHALLCLRPYGSELSRPHRRKPGALFVCLNIFWVATFGWMMFAMHFMIAVAMFASIIFIPFGIVHWRLGVRIIWPMGLVEETQVELVPTLVTTTAPVAVGYAAPAGSDVESV